MKNYLWEILCAIVCVVLLVFRGWPGWPVVVIGGVIILGSCYLTYKGDKNAADDMWWRIASAVISILVIGLAQ